MDFERIGKYRIIGKIGEGAMGKVYKAHDAVLSRYVAVKTMSAVVGMDEDLRKRFHREAQSAARLNHPNIITVYDFGDEQGVAYMAMEFLEGKDLKSIIGDRTVTLDEKLNVMEQICDGLSFAHAMEVVHRDLKPANIHVQPNGQVKILDFGLARLGSSSEMTKTGMVMGTPNYMSPEQVRGEKVDVRSDLFSIGAVFYELLTAHKPFQADSMHAVLFQVLENDPEPPRRWVPTLPPVLVDLVEKALRKDPAERFANGGEMLDAVRHARQTIPFELLSTALPLMDETSATVIGDGPGGADLAAGIQTGVTAARKSRWTSIGSRATSAASDPNLRPAARPRPLPKTLSGRAPTQVEAPPTAAPRAKAPAETGRGAAFFAAGVGLMAVGGAAVWFFAHRAGPSGSTQSGSTAASLAGQPIPAPRGPEASAPVPQQQAPASIPSVAEPQPAAPSTTVPEKPPRSTRPEARAAEGVSTTRPQHPQDDRASRVTPTTAAPAPTVEAPPRVAPPTTESVATLPPPPPVTVPPATVPPTTVAPPTTVVNEEAAIRKVITDYGRAIEEKDLPLFKTLKPNLTADEERRLREAFQGTGTQTVRIVIANVQISGTQATVHLSRQDAIDGHSQTFQQTLQLTKGPGGWTIRDIGR
jgi:serine/threonine protein kinase